MRLLNQVMRRLDLGLTYNKHIQKLTIRGVLTALLLLGLPVGSLFALPEDQGKTLELSANTADLNHQNKRGEYNGHIELDQGTTHLRAAKAITNTDENNKLVSAFAYGDLTLPAENPERLAHYWTQTAVDKPMMHAWAEIIRYYPKRHRIELIGHARVVQGNDSLVAPTIFYDMLKQHVITKNKGKTRTVIIFHPEPPSHNEAIISKGSLINNPPSVLRAPSPHSRGEGNRTEALLKGQA